MGDPLHARRPHLGLATTKHFCFALRVPSAAPILQVRLKPFIRVLMLSPFTFLFFLLVFGLHLITFSCSLGIDHPPFRDIGDLANYQCLTWMKPIILRLFLVGLVYRDISNGLVGSSSLRVTSPSSTSISLSSMRGGHFLLVVDCLRAGLLALTCAAACASATFLASKALIRILACGKFTLLIHSYSYDEYPCMKHLYCFPRLCICCESMIAVTLPTGPSQSSYLGDCRAQLPSLVPMIDCIVVTLSVVRIIITTLSNLLVICYFLSWLSSLLCWWVSSFFFQKLLYLILNISPLGLLSYLKVIFSFFS